MTSILSAGVAGMDICVGSSHCDALRMEGMACRGAVADRTFWRKVGVESGSVPQLHPAFSSSPSRILNALCLIFLSLHAEISNVNARSVCECLHSRRCSTVRVMPCSAI